MQSLNFQKKHIRERRVFAERRAAQHAAVTAKALEAITDAEEPQVPHCCVAVTAKASEAITDAEEPQVPHCCVEIVQAPSSEPSVQATDIQTNASATATASEATAGEEIVTEMACKDPVKSEDQGSEASSCGSVVPERLLHKARR